MQHLPHPSNIGGRLFPDRRHTTNTNNICLKCPRCDSSNTKFCYYNNYNLSQPRHFCKNCRRYWTKGGVLRNVPVGGGCRKSKSRPSKPKLKRAASPGLKPVRHQSRSSSESSSNVDGAAVSIGNNGGLFRVSDANGVDFSVRNSGENQQKSSPNNNRDNDDNNKNTMLISGEFINLFTNENNQFFDCLSNNSQNLPTTSFNQYLGTNSTEIGVNNWSSGAEKDKIGGISDLDWQHPTAENESQGLFDFTSTVDHQTYWSQPMSTLDWSHNANDHPLFLP